MILYNDVTHPPFGDSKKNSRLLQIFEETISGGSDQGTVFPFPFSSYHNPKNALDSRTARTTAQSEHTGDS